MSAPVITTADATRSRYYTRCRVARKHTGSAVLPDARNLLPRFCLAPLSSLSQNSLQLAGTIGIIPSHGYSTVFTLLDDSSAPCPIILQSTHLSYILPLYAFLYVVVFVIRTAVNAFSTRLPTFCVAHIEMNKCLRACVCALKLGFALYIACSSLPIRFLVITSAYYAHFRKCRKSGPRARSSHLASRVELISKIILKRKLPVYTPNLHYRFDIEIQIECIAALLNLSKKRILTYQYFNCAIALRKFLRASELCDHL